jgi:hypothetical protein
MLDPAIPGFKHSRRTAPGTLSGLIILNCRVKGHSDLISHKANYSETIPIVLSHASTN